jgi:hypothetical protein
VSHYQSINKNDQKVFVIAQLLKKILCVNMLNYFKPPSAAKGIRIGEKRRRGRPAKAKKY